MLWVFRCYCDKRPERAKALFTAILRFCPFRTFPFLGIQTQGAASLCPGLCARCPFRAFIPTVLGDISSNRENIFSSWENTFSQLGEIFFPVGEIYFGNWTFFLLKLGRNIALINADTCDGHRRYLRWLLQIPAFGIAGICVWVIGS